MPTPERQATGHWLLPHERWLGRYAGRVQNPPPGGKRWRFQQTYGPEGDVFLTAYIADFVVAVILCFTGAILFNVPKSGPLVTAGYCVLGVGILFGGLGIARQIQLAQVGRDFRAGRSPER